MPSGTPQAGRALATAFAGMAVCIAFGRFTLGLLLPDMRVDLGLGYAAAGSLASLNLAGYLIGVAAVPRLARRSSHLRLVQAGLVVASVGMVVIAVPVHPIALSLAVAATGFAGALGWISSAAVAVESSDGHNRGLLLGIVGTANGAGIVVASVLTWALAGPDGAPWRVVWFLQAALGFLACLFSLTVPAGRKATLARPGSLRGRLAVLHVAYGCFGVGYAWFATFYVASTTARTDLLGAQAWLLVGLGACLGAVPFGTAGDRWGHTTVLSVSQLVAATSCGLVMVLGHRPLAALIAGVLFGSVLAGMASLVPAALAMVVDVADVPSAFAALTLVFAGVQALAPTLGGLVVDHAPYGFTTLFGGSAAFFLVSAAAFATQARGVGRSVPPTP